jgi:hypothetical protein
MEMNTEIRKGGKKKRKKSEKRKNRRRRQQLPRVTTKNLMI